MNCLQTLHTSLEISNLKIAVQIIKQTRWLCTPDGYNLQVFYIDYETTRFYLCLCF